jgi:hypothetical protein
MSADGSACGRCAKAALGLSAASWAAFALAAAMIRTPSPLLLCLVPAQAAFGLSALAVGHAPRWARVLTAALLGAAFAFLFKQSFLAGAPR